MDEGTSASTQAETPDGGGYGLFGLLAYMVKNEGRALPRTELIASVPYAGWVIASSHSDLGSDSYVDPLPKFSSIQPL